ncbi:unnamed protein product, partial [Mesorhabditis spiculigera]
MSSTLQRIEPRPQPDNGMRRVVPVKILPRQSMVPSSYLPPVIFRSASSPSVAAVPATRPQNDGSSTIFTHQRGAGHQLSLQRIDTNAQPTLRNLLRVQIAPQNARSQCEFG